MSDINNSKSFLEDLLAIEESYKEKNLTLPIDADNRGKIEKSEIRQRNPFKLLDAYTIEDRDIFFGRDMEIKELFHMVFSHT